MGTFAVYTGKMDIPEEKRECFGRQMMKLLNYGGMMQFEKVSLFDYELLLLSPVELSSEGKVDFWYNYFEESSWENAGFHMKDSIFYSNKIGNCEFCDVILAAYMLYEMYDESPGFVNCNGEIINPQFYGGWLNHLLGTTFTMKKRYNLWEAAEHIAFYRIDYDNPFSRDELRCLIPDKLLKAAGGTELSDLLYIIYGTESLKIDNIVPASYPEDIYRCKRSLLRLQECYGNKFYERLLQFLQLDRNRRAKSTDENLTALAELSLFLPARVFAYLAAEIKQESFWELWKEWKDKVYCDEQIKQYASEKLQEQRRMWKKQIIPEVKTAEFLRQDKWFTFYDTPEKLKGKSNYYLTDDDRLFWWDGTDEVVISEEMVIWLEELADRHRKLIELPDAGCGDRFEGSNFIKNFIILLDEICSYYKRIFWKEVYEYIENHYEVNKIKKIYLNADGGAWMKAGKKSIAGITYVFDEFHLEKAITKLTSHMKGRKADARKELYEIIRKKKKMDFEEAVEKLESCLTDESGQKRIKDNKAYILSNWTAAKLRLNHKDGVKGCSAEGHVSHVLSSRMSSRPMGWSMKGMSKMAELRAYYYNGGDMLELVRYQKENLQKAAGCEAVVFSCEEMLREERKRRRELGKLGELPVYRIPYPQIRKIANFKGHIYGL